MSPESPEEAALLLVLADVAAQASQGICPCTRGPALFPVAVRTSAHGEQIKSLDPKGLTGGWPEQTLSKGANHDLLPNVLCGAGFQPACAWRSLMASCCGGVPVSAPTQLQAMGSHLCASSC